MGKRTSEHTEKNNALRVTGHSVEKYLFVVLYLKGNQCLVRCKVIFRLKIDGRRTQGEV